MNQALSTRTAVPVPVPNPVGAIPPRQMGKPPSCSFTGPSSMLKAIDISCARDRRGAWATTGLRPQWKAVWTPQTTGSIAPT